MSLLGERRSETAGHVGAVLLGRVATGDRQAFAELYDRLASTVLAIGVARGLTGAAASSFVETVLLELWRRAPEFRRVSIAPTSWVISVIDDCIVQVGGRR